MLSQDLQASHKEALKSAIDSRFANTALASHHYAVEPDGIRFSEITAAYLLASHKSTPFLQSTLASTLGIAPGQLQINRQEMNGIKVLIPPPQQQLLIKEFCDRLLIFENPPQVLPAGTNYFNLSMNEVLIYRQPLYRQLVIRCHSPQEQFSIQKELESLNIKPTPSASSDYLLYPLLTGKDNCLGIPDTALGFAFLELLGLHSHPDSDPSDPLTLMKFPLKESAVKYIRTKHMAYPDFQERTPPQFKTQLQKARLAEAKARKEYIEAYKKESIYQATKQASISMKGAELQYCLEQAQQTFTSAHRALRKLIPDYNERCAHGRLTIKERPEHRFRMFACLSCDKPLLKEELSSRESAAAAEPPAPPAFVMAPIDPSLYFDPSQILQMLLGEQIFTIASSPNAISLIFRAPTLENAHANADHALFILQSRHIIPDTHSVQKGFLAFPEQGATYQYQVTFAAEAVQLLRELTQNCQQNPRFREQPQFALEAALASIQRKEQLHKEKLQKAAAREEQGCLFLKPDANTQVLYNQPIVEPPLASSPRPPLVVPVAQDIKPPASLSNTGSAVFKPGDEIEDEQL
jgi:cellobiose-specific phosphotransferase system component IIA